MMKEMNVKTNIFLITSIFCLLGLLAVNFLENRTRNSIEEKFFIKVEQYIEKQMAIITKNEERQSLFNKARLILSKDAAERAVMNYELLKGEEK